jgi:hypothetical protein
MVDVVWNDGTRPLAIHFLKLRGDVVLEVLAPQHFLGVGIAWLWFVLVISNTLVFTNGNVFHFQVMRPCFA